MKIELKSLKINLTFSEETTMFKANIYVNGKKVGYAENNGRGGSTNIQPFDKQCSDILNKANEYCKTLPPIEYGNMKIDMDLEHFVDNIVNDEANKKEDEKYVKQLNRNCEKGICFGSENKYSIIKWKIPICEMINHNKGKTILTMKLKELVANGETILNKNIPEELYK